MKLGIKKEYLLGAAITSLTLILYLFPLPFIADLELLYQKAQFNWRGPEPSSGHIVVATVDEKSLDKLGRWPWPRDILARIVDNLTDLGAKVIAFDMVFSEPDDSGGSEEIRQLRDTIKEENLGDPATLNLMEEYIKSTDRDSKFAESIRKSGKVVLGYFFHFQSSSLSHLTRGELDRKFLNIKPTRFRGFIKSKDSIDLAHFNIPEAWSMESNLEMLSRQTRNAGFFSFDVESDGTLRRQPLLVRYYDPESKRNFFFPSLSAKSVEKFLDGTLLFKVGPAGIEKVFVDSESPVVIPTNYKGEVLVNFLGPRGNFPYVSMADIYSPEEEGLDPNRIKDKIVLVGASATALGDIRMTPFDPALPGVEIHGMIIENILNGNALSRPAWLELLEVGFIVVWGMALTFFFSRTNPVRGLAFWILLNLGYFSIVQWVFVNEQVFLFGTLPALQSLGIFSLIGVMQFLEERSQKQFIRGVFDQYVSPQVIDRLVAHPEHMKLGGEQKELTAFFTDLAGFTTFSEQMTAEAQVTFLNEYLGEMTHILLRHDGTLDKYDGDAIKAFFGAPVFFEDHAKKACLVAIDMQNRLGELRQQWKAQGLPELRMRVGINTGMIVVGNLGSRNRMNYGMNGDAVNLAARLEGANKFYGTETMISESTYLQAKDWIEVRELDCFQVSGRKNAVKTFELLGVKGELSPEKKKVVAIYESALESYKKGQWQDAISLFEKVLREDPLDGPSKVLMSRCREFEKTPPELGWSGVYSLSSK